jgi:uncharacterized iron-regulated membrane protein
MVFAHPSTGAIVGELRREGFMSSVWSLHANLIAGDVGRRVNCTLGLFALVLFGTGLVIWWPGAARWWRALGVNGKGGWRRVTRQLHGAVGIWTFAFLVVSAATGALYYYGPQFYRILAVVSLRNDPAPMQSDSALAGNVSRPRNQDLIARAEAAYPGKSLWGFYPPMSAKAPIQLVIGPIGDDLGRHTWDWDATDQHYLYFDQYSGRLLGTWDVRNRSVADVVRAWVVPLHRGTFDGLVVRILWTVLGVAPAALFIAGAIMWWTRVLRPWQKRRAS